MIYNLATFEQFFNAFEGQHGIESVVIGGYDELVQLQNSQAKYPCLVVEIPDETHEIDGNIQFQTRIAVLKNNAKALKTADYKTQLTDARDILKAVLNAMQADTANVVFRPSEVRIEYISRGQMLTGDSLFGAIASDVSFTSNYPCP